MKIDKKKIGETVKHGLKTGKTKEEIYEEITSYYKDYRLQKEIANIIRFTPEKEKIRKYGIYNWLFLILLIVIDLINVLTFNYSGIIWFGALTYLVITTQTKYYYWFIVFGAIIFISGIVLTLYGYFGNGLNPFSLIGGTAVLATIFISFGILMPKYLTPDYVIKEEIVIDTDGERRKKKRIKYN